jgi:hypothetical protein
MALVSGLTVTYHKTMSHCLHDRVHLAQEQKMSKPTKLLSVKSKSASGGVPFVVLVGLFGLGLVGYVFSQMFLPVEAHSLHWLIALLGAVIGGVLGWLWYRWRGDLI